MVSNNALPTRLRARRREGKPVMGRQEKSGVRLLCKFWQEKEPATGKATGKETRGVAFVSAHNPTHKPGHPTRPPAARGPRQTGFQRAPFARSAWLGAGGCGGEPCCAAGTPRGGAAPGRLRLRLLPPAGRWPPARARPRARRPPGRRLLRPPGGAHLAMGNNRRVTFLLFAPFDKTPCSCPASAASRPLQGWRSLKNSSTIQRLQNAPRG